MSPTFPQEKNMYTMTASPVTRKPAPRAYYCVYHDRHGIISTLNDEILFMDSDDNALDVVEPPDFCWIAVLGEIGLADTQQLMDKMHHGYAAIACSRAN